MKRTTLLAAAGVAVLALLALVVGAALATTPRPPDERWKTTLRTW
jgi:hypothetical protein